MQEAEEEGGEIKDTLTGEDMEEDLKEEIKDTLTGEDTEEVAEDTKVIDTKKEEEETTVDVIIQKPSLRFNCRICITSGRKRLGEDFVQ